VAKLTDCGPNSARYEEEKAGYKGPWKIAAHNKRSTKDPSAPKRPMSAFLAYSNSRRAELKRQTPKATNADLSKMLSKSWKELPPTERAGMFIYWFLSHGFLLRSLTIHDFILLVYMEEEAEKRAKYKADMAVWRKKAAKQKKSERVDKEEMEAPMAPSAMPAPSLGRGGLQNDSAQMQQQQLMEQMQQQEQFMGNGLGMSAGQGLPGLTGAHGSNDASAMSQMTMEQQHQILAHQQREAMLAGAGGDATNMGSMSGDSNAASAQQNLNSGLFGAGNNPYSLQASGGFGGFPGMGAAAFGLNAASTNPYLANALAANQYMQGAAGQAGLSALMGKSLHLGSFFVILFSNES
jgi:HMG (high mobility group) box